MWGCIYGLGWGKEQIFAMILGVNTLKGGYMNQSLKKQQTNTHTNIEFKNKL